MSQFEKPWGNYLLDGFIEMAPPETISWLPQTLGWKLVGLFLIVALFNYSYRAWQRYKFNKYRREATAWLHQLTPEKYPQIPAVLKRTAQKATSRKSVSQLNGKAWNEWLDKHCTKSNFTEKCPSTLYKLAYAPNESLTEDELSILINEVKLWVKFHEVKA